MDTLWNLFVIGAVLTLAPMVFGVAVFAVIAIIGFIINLFTRDA